MNQKAFLTHNTSSFPFIFSFHFDFPFALYALSALFLSLVSFLLFVPFFILCVFSVSWIHGFHNCRLKAFLLKEKCSNIKRNSNKNKPSFNKVFLIRLNMRRKVKKVRKVKKTKINEVSIRSKRISRNNHSRNLSHV